MTNSKNIPKRRFKEFESDGEWGEFKLGQLMDVGSVKRVHQSDWREKGIRFLRARDIVAEAKNEKLDDFLYIDEELYNSHTSLTGKVQKGDILVTGVGTIGVPLLIQAEEPLYFKDGNIIWFKNNNMLDGHFFYFNFLSTRIQKFIDGVAGIGTVGTFTIDSGKKTPIYLPSLKDEQIKIGAFLQKIDSLIILHQHKLDKLKNLKKSYLSELFPAEGERVPKRRFPGFEGEWEEKKLKDVSEIYDGTHQTPRYTTDGIMFLSVENIKTLKSNKYISKDDFIKDFKIFPQNGDVLMTRIGDIGTSNVVNTDDKLAFYVSLALIRSAQLDSKFLNTSISSVNFQKELWSRTLHIAFPKKINKNEIGEVSILFPSISEQKQIGSFFQNLDKSVTLQQQKLDKLKDLKKAYLNELFV